ncbi:hypothetical protein GUITHDRAFT_146299 [Guillardia theta CCMP2712]|uniref:BHLH domain-containing protein n=1 Tax=Guillardia theta (strain CCMP2712) TaxID=905079 RepID=L1III8_GUITC|nr:hypothetical protein GUITHDRAFT_146299 [Guillardia theta CCMP2712]EKX35744.1 hypothetical protein GUITHDRAFT_146299 [Guillardia theta CCMP2712]|eukprot:XP_005822724.1 hypothetical protein GUITHDRAFT_146299 [Guillardia theta CCMP2712]
MDTKNVPMLPSIRSGSEAKGSENAQVLLPPMSTPTDELTKHSLAGQQMGNFVMAYNAQYGSANRKPTNLGDGFSSGLMLTGSSPASKRQAQLSCEVINADDVGFSSNGLTGLTSLPSGAQIQQYQALQMGLHPSVLQVPLSTLGGMHGSVLPLFGHHPMTNGTHPSTTYQPSDTSSSTSGMGAVLPNRAAAAPNGGISNLSSRNGIGITLTAHGSGNNSGGSSTTCNHNSSGGDSDDETRDQDGRTSRRIARREYHKKIERKRRDRMRSLYDELRQLTDAAELADKNGVLEGAIALIQELRQENTKLLKLKQENNDLRQENARLIKSPQAFPASMVQVTVDKDAAAVSLPMQAHGVPSAAAVSSASSWNDDQGAARGAKRAKVNGVN